MSRERRTSQLMSKNHNDDMLGWQFDRDHLQQPDLTTTTTATTADHRTGPSNEQWGNWMDSSVVTPPILSPTTPPRVLSSHSLLGEHIMSSSRQPCDEFGAAMVAPNAPTTPPAQSSHVRPGDDEATATTPTSSLPHYPSLSPPPLLSNNNSNNSNNNLSTLEIVATSSASVASKGTHKGRPPRAPPQPSSGSLPTQRGGKNFPHSRVPSFSDCSLLSALTDGSTSDTEQQQHQQQLHTNNSNSAPPLMKPYLHQKAHSWDFNTTWLEGINNSSSNSAPISILQPILNDEEDDDDDEEEHDPRNLSFSPERSEVGTPIRIRAESLDALQVDRRRSSTSNSLPKRTPSTTSVMTTKRLVLADVLNSFPIESNAESHIFRGMETLRETYRNVRKQSAFATFLERLPPSTLEFITASGALLRHEANLDASASTHPTTATTTTNATEARPISNSPAFSWELENERSPMSHDVGESQKFILILKRAHENLLAAVDTADKDCHKSRETQQRRDLFFAVLPILVLGVVVLHGNSLPETTSEGQSGDSTTASVWLVCQLIIFGLARAAEFFLRIALPCQAVLHTSAPTSTLLLSQSKGWPAQVCFWGFLNLIVLTGTNRCVGQWQHCVNMLNDSRFLSSMSVAAMIVGFLVSAKRTLVGLYAGKRLVACYFRPLQQVMQSMMLISELALWSTEKDRASNSATSIDGCSFEFYGKSDLSSLKSSGIQAPSRGKTRKGLPNFSGHSNISLTRQFLKWESEERKRAASKQNFPIEQSIMTLIKQWEEPEKEVEVSLDVSILSMLHFRRALNVLDADYPFSLAFGNVQRRERCIESAQNVFNRLATMSKNPDVVQFTDVISCLARTGKGELDRDKVIQLIRLFRPDRQGKLSRSDFVKSIDTVYNSLRRLQASVVHRSIMFDSCFGICNGVFYAFLGGLGCSAFLRNVPHSLIFALGFVAWSTLCARGVLSKCMEGIFLVAIRRPFEIGDRVVISDVTADANCEGSLDWIVETFDLFTTTLRRSSSDETTNMANSSLANYRIVNRARSKHAVIQISLQFGLGLIGSNKFDLFKSDVESFIRSRPREWLSFMGLRLSRVLSESVEYVLIAQHRESWQLADAIQQSKAELHSFCLEWHQKMDQRNKSSPPPAITVTG